MIKIEDKIYEIEIEDIKELFKERDMNSHKGMFGLVGIMGGSIKYSGSVKLSNISATAMRSGCGIIRVIVPEIIAPSMSQYLLEQTLYPIACDSKNYMKTNNKDIMKAISDLKALSIGMGWDKSNNNKIILSKILEIYSGILVIDADGLNNLAEIGINKLKTTKAKIILTPHLKEMERITNIKIEDIKKDSINIAREFAKKYEVIILLKGSTTIITDGNLTYLTKTGCPGMATAGSGDVLSGIIIGMLGYQKANILTVAASSYLAGLAGEMAQEEYTDISMIASDTIKFIPKAIKYIRNK